MSSPVLTILAGSNGCGKSTLTSGVREEFQQSPILDPDAFAKSIRDTAFGGSDLEAGKRVLLEVGKRVLLRAEQLIQKGQSFTVETTLSGSTYLRMAARAKKAGYVLCVIFVGTATVEINIERVKGRVIKGGHDVPEEDQRRRYPRTLANMSKLLPMADLAVLLDNSTTQGYTLVAVGGPKAFMHWTTPVPDWAAGMHLRS